MNVYISTIFLIFFIQIRNFQYSCNFDEECPSGFACYQTFCQDLTFFSACNSYCSPGCCVDSKCRIANQKICTSINSCSSGSDCLGQCCIQNKCSQPKYCGINPAGSDCTDNNLCSSKCCLNNVCLDSSDSKCKNTDYIDSDLKNDSIKIWILLAIDIILLIVIVILIYVFRNRLIEKDSILKEIAESESSRIDFNDYNSKDFKEKIATEIVIKKQVNQISSNSNIPNFTTQIIINKTQIAKTNLPFVRQVVQPKDISPQPVIPNYLSNNPTPTAIISPNEMQNSANPLKNNTSASTNPYKLGNYVIINPKKDVFE